MKLPLFTAIAASLFFPLFAQTDKETKPGDDLEFLSKSALEIDRHIAAFYRAKKLPVPQVTDDATFMRRAFLVSIGRIPTAEEALAFIEIDEPAKRQELVAYLMGTQGYSSHMTNWAFDLLRLRDANIGTTKTNEPYRSWIRKAMAENMPWDDFVTSLVSATSGNAWDPKTATVGYYIMDRGMPLDNLANTTRIFLGSRMECAQCHDDPFGGAERKDFYHLAAFTHGQDLSKKTHLFTPIYAKYRTGDQKDNVLELDVSLMFVQRIYEMYQEGNGEGRITLPSDYQYRDGDPGEMIGAKTPFGKTVRMSERKAEGGGHQELASWIVSKTGEQFPAVIANRMWQRIMGKGIYEPVDDYIVSSKTVHPELMGYLAKLMHDLDYDLRAFQHVLMLTKTFQFITNPNPSSIDGNDDFHGRKIARLSAEQVWDSLITLSSGDPDKIPIRTPDNRIFIMNQPVLVGEMDMTQLSEEVLALDTEREVQNYFDDFVKKVKTAGVKKESKQDSMSMGMAPVRKYSNDSPVRASELPSPAPSQHLLYVFGASERDVVDGASKEANVGQVLSMMNGYVQRQLVGNSGAHLYKCLEGASSTEEKIRRIYIAILNRPPSAEEMGWMKEEVGAQGEAGYRNMVASLVMSSEFIFLQ